MDVEDRAGTKISEKDKEEEVAAEAFTGRGRKPQGGN